MTKRIKIYIIVIAIVAVISYLAITYIKPMVVLEDEADIDNDNLNNNNMSFPNQPTPYIPVDNDFYNFFQTLGIRNFTASELLVKGAAHDSSVHAGYGLNTDPPEELWPNIVDTLRILDEFRDFIGLAIIITSVYRSPAYNKAIGGASASEHKEFNAIDFKVVGPEPQSTYAIHLHTWRNNGKFKGGLKAYNSFIHIDTRGYNADW